MHSFFEFQKTMSNMSKIDRIEADIEATKTKLSEAETAKDFARRDRLEALLTKQTGVWENLLAAQSKFLLQSAFQTFSFTPF